MDKKWAVHLPSEETLNKFKEIVKECKKDASEQEKITLGTELNKALKLYIDLREGEAINVSMENSNFDEIVKLVNDSDFGRCSPPLKEEPVQVEENPVESTQQKPDVMYA